MTEETLYLIEERKKIKDKYEALNWQIRDMRRSQGKLAETTVKKELERNNQMEKMHRKVEVERKEILCAT